MQIVAGRKFFIFYLILFIPVLMLRAQDMKWDSTYRPEIYPVLRDGFAQETNSQKDIIFLGNSITFWGLFNQRLNDNHIKNRGIPGDVTSGVLERIDETIAGKPAKIFLLIGINDMARNFPDSVILFNYKKIIERIREVSPGTKLFVQSILPTNHAFGKLNNYYNRQKQTTLINSNLRQLAEQSGSVYIDLYSIFADEKHELKRSLTYDGVHLTNEGYNLWLSFLKSKKYLN